jgi:hypothetical protein
VEVRDTLHVTAVQTFTIIIKTMYIVSIINRFLVAVVQKIEEEEQ